MSIEMRTNAEKNGTQGFSCKEKRHRQRFALSDTYNPLRQLNAELLFQLIDRIDVHQGKYIGEEKRQQIDIWFRFQCQEETLEFDEASAKTLPAEECREMITQIAPHPCGQVSGRVRRRLLG